MNAIFLRLSVWLGSECSSQAQPRTATPLLLPDCLHSQSPSGSPRWLALFGLICCLGSCRWSFFLLLPDLHCARSNRSAATEAACTVPLPLQEGPTVHETGRQGMQRCQAGSATQDLALWRVHQRHPVAGRLWETFFLHMPASTERNPVPPFLLGNASQACLGLLQGNWG